MSKTAEAPQVIADRYQISGRIGSGGMGQVLRARDSVLGRSVALKILPAELATRPEFVERFKAEAQAAARLSHPNVVQVHDWGEQDLTYYMVMEYVRGRNLRQILGAVGKISPHQSAQIILQVLRALSAAHEKGVVHRDIKPENIIVATDGKVKVTDFGIARVVQDAGLTGSMMGTVAYAAPEQARGGEIDGRTDLYATGCVLYELLTGSLPFEGDAVRILHQHLHDRVAKPSVDVPEAAPLDQIVLRATNPKIEDRYPSAEAMGRDLAQAASALTPSPGLAELTHELTSEVPVESIDTVVPRKKKKRWGRWVLAAILAIGLIAGGLYIRPVQVPNVIGLSQSEAGQRVEKSGLDPRFERLFSDAPEGAVFRTEPVSGTKVRRGGQVSLVISAGPELTDVPTIIGLQIEDAKKQILDKGLAVGTVEDRNAREPLGKVLDQDPKPGRARRGDPVNVVVSIGPKISPVPPVTGKNADEAQEILQAAGFEVVREDVFSDAEKSIVTAQVPKAGDPAEQSSPVKLLVSKGPKPYPIPDVKGKPCSEAKAQLDAAGLVTVVKSSSGGAAACGAGKIIEQDPLPGSTVKKGQEATLYVG